VFVTANPTQIGDGDGALGYIRKPFTERAILAAAAMATSADAPANDDVVAFSGAMAGDGSRHAAMPDTRAG
jgi:hypothetical protein